MNSDAIPELRAELLDDFYAECDEHLTEMRGHCAALEAAVAGNTAVRVSALAGCFARLHSFKGNAAIVGLAAAERLAHSAEGMLRALHRGETPLEAEHVDLANRVVHRLAQVVTAFRLHSAPPSTDDLLLELAEHGGEKNDNVPVAAASAPLTTPSTAETPDPGPGRTLWRAKFSPSAALDLRGININTVRQRLAALGEILAATPVIAHGAVSFELLVALTEPPAGISAWTGDGVEWSPVAAAPTKGRGRSETSRAPLGSGALSIAPSHIVRVDLSRLDDLMRITGDLVIQHSRLQERLATPVPSTAGLRDVSAGFTRSLREMREALQRVRMVPVGEIFSRLPFVLRDLAGESGKKVQLVVEGQETEIDKFLVERLKEPLLHLVRNAVSHGIESPEERSAAGKPETARVRLRAAAVGDTVTIELEDDGRGIDAARVRERARAHGIVVPADFDEAGLLALICTAGVSTKERADRAAGRGVGMAVVADTVRELGGALTLATRPGEWTRFTLRLPLSLSITGAFVVSVGEQTCAVPQAFIQEIVPVAAADLRMINDVEVAPYRDGLLPVVRLRTALGEPRGGQEQVPVLVVNSERGLAGLVADRVFGRREIVVRPLLDPLVQVPGVAGATELGDGRPILILEPTVLTRGAVRPHAAAVPVESSA